MVSYDIPCDFAGKSVLDILGGVNDNTVLCEQQSLN